MDVGLVGCFSEADVTKAAAMDAGMLLGTRHYQVGSDGGSSSTDDSTRFKFFDLCYL